MTQYHAPRADLEFILFDVLKLEQHHDVPGYGDADRDTIGAILDEADRLAQAEMWPLRASGDQQGCSLSDGKVSTPEGFQRAFTALREGGWTALDLAPAFGGQGMPVAIGAAVGEIFCASNMALNMYHGLTHGAFNAIAKHGNSAQKELYLPKLASCEWTGTMNLTEPQCGTDLGLIRTQAVPHEDGSYRITGDKIFISSGDHDLAENIIHLVLARSPNGPAGTKGLSLFIVPKILVDTEGNLGERNAVLCDRIEQKMGIHGNATCAMRYDGATGYLLGELNKGMRAMFTMMNEARLFVGLQGYAQAEAAYQLASTYAKDRLQGRAVSGAVNPDAAADPLIVHPDIRRILLDQKSFIEAARALTLWGGMLLDRAERSGDTAAEGLISLLIPVIKGHLTDRGFESCVEAQQVFGGHGYITEWGVEQFVRDSRIAMIYEGANGIQAIDLVGRKLGADGGRHITAFLSMIRAFCSEHQHVEDLQDILTPLSAGAQDLENATLYFMQNGLKDPEIALSGATDYMHLMGVVTLGYMWAQMAEAACAQLKVQQGDQAFLHTKLTTAFYYAQRHLPLTKLHLNRIKSGKQTIMAMDIESF